MLNSINNNQPTFGMAVVKPTSKTAMQEFAKAIGTASDSFITRRTARAGLKQMIRQNASNPYNIAYDSANNTFNVLEPITKNIKEKFEITTTHPAKTVFQKISRGLRRGYNVIFNPKGELPKAFRDASNAARGYHQWDIAKAERAKIAQAKLEKAAARTEQAFEEVKAEQIAQRF